MKKNCSKCKQDLDLEKFSRNKNYKDGRHCVCKSCQLEYNRSRNFPPSEDPSRKKKCPSCSLEFPATLENFSPQKSSRDGMSYYCKSCQSEMTKATKKEVCSQCHKLKQVCCRLEDGSALCSYCRLLRNPELCANCGETKTVGKRLDNGQALCQNCHNNSRKEICVDCGQLRTPNVRLENGTSRCATCQRKTSPEAWYKLYQKGARQRDLEFAISFDHFVKLASDTCHYCGAPSTVQHHFIGVDRVDNDLGYTEENTVPCCELCNRMKGTLSQQEFMDQIGNIYLYGCKIAP